MGLIASSRASKKLAGSFFGSAYFVEYDAKAIATTNHTNRLF